MSGDEIDYNAVRKDMIVHRDQLIMKVNQLNDAVAAIDSLVGSGILPSKPEDVCIVSLSPEVDAMLKGKLMALTPQP